MDVLRLVNKNNISYILIYIVSSINFIKFLAYKLYEGLKNADMLLAQVEARMAAFGLDNSDFNNLNNTGKINLN